MNLHAQSGTFKVELHASSVGPKKHLKNNMLSHFKVKDKIILNYYISRRGECLIREKADLRSLCQSKSFRLLHLRAQEVQINL